MIDARSEQLAARELRLRLRDVFRIVTGVADRRDALCQQAAAQTRAKVCMCMFHRPGSSVFPAAVDAARVGSVPSPPSRRLRRRFAVEYHRSIRYDRAAFRSRRARRWRSRSPFRLAAAGLLAICRPSSVTRACCAAISCGSTEFQPFRITAPQVPPDMNSSPASSSQTYCGSEIQTRRFVHRDAFALRAVAGRSPF